MSRHGGIANAKRVSIGRVARRNVADGGLLGVLRIADVKRGVLAHRPVVEVAGNQRGRVAGGWLFMASFAARQWDRERKCENGDQRREGLLHGVAPRK